MRANGLKCIRNNSQVIRRDDEIVHETAIEPSLALLRHPAFCHANEEFREALKEYRLEEYKDCVTKCASAYESVLKVICERKGWKLRGSGNATNLLTTVLNNTGWSQYYKNALQVVFIIRNEESTSHGAGSQPKNVPQHVAKYAISATASAIQLLVEDTGQGIKETISKVDWRTRPCSGAIYQAR